MSFIKITIKDILCYNTIYAKKKSQEAGDGTSSLWLF